MIFSTVVAASILALVPSSLALAIGTRDNACTFACPQNDAHGNGLSGSSVNGNSLSCTYAGGSGNLCIYDIVSVRSSRIYTPAHAGAQASGALNGNKDGCPGQAVQQCPSTQSPKKNDPSPNGGKRDGSQLASSPSPNQSTGNPGSQPSKDQPAKDQPSKDQPAHSFKCPQKDLAQNPLTNQVIGDPASDCSYSTFNCKYNTVCWDVERTVRFADNRCAGNRGSPRGSRRWSLPPDRVIWGSQPDPRTVTIIDFFAPPKRLYIDLCERLASIDCLYFEHFCLSFVSSPCITAFSSYLVYRLHASDVR